jgi:DNA-dependent RNA polymerase auxiliary subunit epsilon
LEEPIDIDQLEIPTASQADEKVAALMAEEDMEVDPSYTSIVPWCSGPWKEASGQVRQLAKKRAHHLEVVKKLQDDLCNEKIPAVSHLKLILN